MKACPFCAEEIQDAAIICKHCQRSVVTRAQTAAAVGVAEPVTVESPYYERVFAEFDQNGGAFRPKWNWAAFLFSGIWYLTKGLWAKGAFMFVAAILSAGLLGPVIWIYAGVAGNFDYYLLQRKRKQLW